MIYDLEFFSERAWERILNTKQRQAWDRVHIFAPQNYVAEVPFFSLLKSEAVATEKRIYPVGFLIASSQMEIGQKLYVGKTHVF